MSYHTFRSASKTPRRFYCEMLESRRLLAGTVTASIKNGNLLVQGGASSGEQISVTSGPIAGQYVISSLDGSTINGASSATLTGVRKDIQIDLRGGGNVVRLHDLTTPGNVSIVSQSGRDVFTVANAIVKKGLTINGKGNGATQVDVVYSTIGEHLCISTNGGNDRICVLSTSTKSSTFDTGTGDDELEISHVAAKTACFTGGAGKDTLSKDATNSLNKVTQKQFETVDATIDCQNTDTDGDSLPDLWELYGVDSNSDGKVDFNLPAQGANPLHKDLFVELDYMEFHRPMDEAIADVVTAFANAPLSNPDGSTGIALHVAIDDQVAHDDDLNPVWTEFHAIKAANFGTAAERANPNAANLLAGKRLIYRYSLWAHQWNSSGSSGIAEIDLNANGIPTAGGNDFIVALGAPGWGLNAAATHTVGSRVEQAGTFMHELGHTLGLGHGGGDSINYKANYISAMNYAFQFLYSKFGNPLDYSRSILNLLDENNLSEPTGLNTSIPPGLATLANPGDLQLQNFVLRLVTAGSAIDWNNNGSVTDNGIAVDINRDGRLTTLSGFEDWSHIRFSFRDSSGFANGDHLGSTLTIGELDVETYATWLENLD